MEAKIDASEQNYQTNTRFSPDMIEERIKANLEPLHAQISALTEMMDRLIQGNSARELTTASTREHRPQSESPFAQPTGASRFPLITPLTIARYSPDNRCKVNQILPLMVEYACFLVNCIIYQNVMSKQKIYFLLDLGKFLQKNAFLPQFCKK